MLHVYLMLMLSGDTTLGTSWLLSFWMVTTVSRSLVTTSWFCCCPSPSSITDILPSLSSILRLYNEKCRPCWEKTTFRIKLYLRIWGSTYVAVIVISDPNLYQMWRFHPYFLYYLFKISRSITNPLPYTIWLIYWSTLNKNPQRSRLLMNFGSFDHSHRIKAPQNTVQRRRCGRILAGHCFP